MACAPPTRARRRPARAPRLWDEGTARRPAPTPARADPDLCTPCQHHYPLPTPPGSLLSLLRQLARLRSDKKAISVGFIGYPNVGKSSVINALRTKKVRV